MLKLSRFVAIWTLMLAAFAFMTVGSAHAAFDKTELKCRKGIAKNVLKSITTGHKTIAGCHKGRNAGKIGAGTDCNDLSSSGADAKGKFAKATTKLNDQFTKCSEDGNAGVLQVFQSCPDPCETSLGLPNPLTSFAEVSQCLQCVVTNAAQDLGTATLGTPPAVPLSKEDGKCHAAIAKGYGKYLATTLKERSKCQAAADKLGEMTVAGSGCATADPKLKIAGAKTKASDGINKSCPPPTSLANLDSCSAVDLPGLIACLETETETTGDAEMPRLYELAATLCPVAIDTKILANNGLDGTTVTVLDVGWKGISHGVDLQDQYNLSFDVTCGSSTPPCGTCTVDGVSSSGPQYAAFTRCSNDFSVECTMPFAADPACGGSTCVPTLGPPLPISAGNNPTCSINAMVADVTGTVEPDIGASSLSLQLQTKVHTGIGLSTPCPVCEGDSTPQDGVRDGTCSGGADDGQPCDIQAFDASFASQANGQGLSLDCAPDPLSNITGVGLNIPLELTTGSTLLEAENACDGVLGFLDCFCGVCSLDVSFPCRNDGECSSAGKGTCSSFGTGLARQPDDCQSVGGCEDPDGNGIGECADPGPIDTFCDGAVRSNGQGYIGCSSNVDCDVVGSECPDNDCGTCSLTKRRSCFSTANGISATGTPDVFRPISVGTFCIPPTNNAAINGVSGSPGPVRAITETQTTKRF